MIWLLRMLTVAGIVLVALAMWEQPRMADDVYVSWLRTEHYGSYWSFVTGTYQHWTGRLLQFMISGIALSSETATKLFHLCSVLWFLLFSACAYYLATGTAPRLGRAEGRNWLIMTAVLWLGSPVVSDTVVQTVGATAYLWPAAADLAMLCLFRHARDQARVAQVISGGWTIRVGWLAAGILVGTSNEQLFAGMVVVLAGWGWMLWRGGQFRNLPIEVWFGLGGIILGALVLVAAPGNYIRLEFAEDGGDGILSRVIRFGLYMGGAYFGLGTGDAGRALWLGISVIALSGVFTLANDRGKEAGIWAAGSLATLLPMFPLVYFASPRTTFFAVAFIVIAVAILFPRKGDSGVSVPPSFWLVAFSMAILVLIDGFVGWAANRSLAIEMAERLKIIRVAAAEGRKEVVVPYLATIPSRLTYMVDAKYDAIFVQKLAVHYGLAHGRQDEAAGAPRPQTLNPLKALKNSF